MEVVAVAVIVVLFFMTVMLSGQCQCLLTEMRWERGSSHHRSWSPSLSSSVIILLSLFCRHTLANQAHHRKSSNTLPPPPDTVCQFVVVVVMVASAVPEKSVWRQMMNEQLASPPSSLLLFPLPSSSFDTSFALYYRLSSVPFPR